MSGTNVHKHRNLEHHVYKKAKEDRTGAVTAQLLCKHLDDALANAGDALDAPAIADRVATRITRQLLSRPELLKIHLRNLVRNSTAAALYRILSGERPKVGEWADALEPGDPEETLPGGWFEHVDGQYRRIYAMSKEELERTADEREKRIQSQVEAVEELRRAAREMPEDHVAAPTGHFPKQAEDYKAAQRRQLPPVPDAEMHLRHYEAAIQLVVRCNQAIRDKEDPDMEVEKFAPEEVRDNVQGLLDYIKALEDEVQRLQAQAQEETQEGQEGAA